MNRSIYRLIFNTTSGMLVPVAEIARGCDKRGGMCGRGLLFAALLLAAPAQAELPVPCAVGACGAGIPDFVSAGQAAYHAQDHHAVISQVGDKAILNWETFNVSAGHSVQFQQVDSLAAQHLVQGASFTTLNRIWGSDPSVIAGILTQATGQSANVILVNTNGIAFMGSSQVNLNSFTASSLDIKDSFILNAFLTTQKNIPQFEGSGGFVKVLEGARITAGSQGRVMLIAPTVINSGSVTAPDGQVIAAAGTKVFLRSASAEPVDANVRGLLVEVDSPVGLSDFQTSNTGVKDGKLDGQTVPLRNAEQDKLGHVTNFGELSTPRGNVTMVGYAVNQQGIVRATTSVTANGSVYLLAKDFAVAQDSSLRGGRAVLGAGSVTEILPETADKTGLVDGLTGQGLVLPSQVRVLGQDIRMESGAVINAPAGGVSFFALDDPSTLFTPNDPFLVVNAPVSSMARIHIAGGARINVAGLERVPVSAARNGVAVELRGDELKDSPVNRDGPLRSQTVYVDINRALNNANAGVPTLIAKDSLQSYQARLERTVAERSTLGGVVLLNSQGEAIVESGAVFDISGGSVAFTPASVPTTLVMSRGVLTDIANARADVRYDGIATRYVQDFGRWNVKEVIDLGQTFNSDPGYTEGKNAGAMEIIALGTTVMQGDIQGRTTVGEVQRDLGIMPTGARLTVGIDPVANALSAIDYKFNQALELGNSGANILPGGFKFGDPLSPSLVTTLNLNSGLVGKDKVANLEIFSNQAVVVREALRAPLGGSIHITAEAVTVGADIESPSGSITLNAHRNDIDPVPPPLNVTVADGITLSARGVWVNELPPAPVGSGDVALVDGGKITLAADDNLALGQGSLLDVTAGGRLRADGRGRVIAGNAGEISLSGHTLSGFNENVRGFGITGGGTLTLSSNRIQIGGVPDLTADTLNLDPGFFSRTGFANIKLAGIESVTLSDNTRIRPTVVNLELLPEYRVQPSGSRVEDFSRLVTFDDLIRQPANLGLTANNPDEQGKADVLIGMGAQIEADPGAHITLSAARLIDIEGRVSAPGGSISASLQHSEEFNYNPDNGIWLGKQSGLDVSGVALTFLDTQRLTQGKVLNGGSVTLDAQFGNVITQASSTINVAGASPVRLDILNEAGGLGQWVGSDAGSLSITAREGILLDGKVVAQPGGALNRGGNLDITLGLRDVSNPQDKGFPSGDRVLSLAQTVAPQASGLTPGTPVPTELNRKAPLDATALESAGFDRLTLKGREVIRLENDLNLGVNRPLALRELVLDAPRIETAGGGVALKAEVIRLGNFDIDLQDVPNTPLSGNGTFSAEAQLLELAGNLSLGGMAQSKFSAAQEVRLSGISTSNFPRPTAMLSSAANLSFHGAVIAPATYTQFDISAPGRTVTFSHNSLPPSQPLSALGSLTVSAENIVQNGNLWAPFGQLTFNATGNLTFGNESVTSVAAVPGSLIPFGVTVNGRSWFYRTDLLDIPQPALAEKSIRVQAENIDMQPGATVNLAGGGDLQAYEFSVGPGGSRDILNDPGVYAVVSGYSNSFAPGDTQENRGFDRSAGEAVYLSGMPGLPAGVYTLLPAHYALLPGAFAVRLSSPVPNLLPGQAYTMQDGAHIVPGYVTDSRSVSGGPRDALWSGFEVLTREQVLQRSEIMLTHASSFFADSIGRPQDGGLLSLDTSQGLKLDAIFQLAAAEGGRGAAVDINAANIVITNGTSSAGSTIDPLATRLEVAKLNGMGAASLLIGATRNTAAADTIGATTTLTVGAEKVTLANDAAHALKGEEIILAARDTLTLKSGSAIEAQNTSTVGQGRNYSTEGNGALVRAASTSAGFIRTGSPDRSTGTLAGEAGSTIRASDSITLDATGRNAFAGTTAFTDRSGNPVAGNFSVGATRVNFGNAPVGAEGLTLSQGELNALDALKSVTLTSYSTFDLYGDVSIGGENDQGKPTLQALTLTGAGLAGLQNAGKTATLRAGNILFSNPAASPFTAGGTPGTGSVAIYADKLMLGDGIKAIQGFSQVSVNANELIGRESGSMDINADAASLNVARISSEQGSNQAVSASGTLTASKATPDRELSAVNLLGGQWTLSGAAVKFDTVADLPSGQFKLAATMGNLELGSDATVNTAGHMVTFFDVARASPGGTVELASENGDVVVRSGAKVDVSSPAGADAGRVIVRAPTGTVTLAAGSLMGIAATEASGAKGDGGRFELDVDSLGSFSTLNGILDQGMFDGGRALRVRTGDVSVAATDVVKAQAVRIAVDGGKLEVRGRIDASGEKEGRINLYAGSDVTVLSGAKLDVHAVGEGMKGGKIEIGTTQGRLNFAQGSTADVRGGGQAGEGGQLLLRAPRTGSGAGSDVATDNLGISVSGAKSFVVEAVKVYDNIQTLTGSGTSTGTTLSLATVNSDNATFASHAAAITARLGKTGDATFHLRTGVEVVSPSDLTLTNDWNLGTSRAAGEPGMLTLRAGGNLNISNNLSDGFDIATAVIPATRLSGDATPATLLSGDSWGYRLVAGADRGAADPLAVIPGGGDVTLAAGKLVRTGTGDISIASGGDITFADAKSAIYTAGRAADPLDGFTPPANAQFSQGGGDIRLSAGGDIVGSPSAQLYSNWLFRQGKLGENTGQYTRQPAWWIRFDQFQQGVAALGGGNVTLTAGGKIENISASSATQARMAATTPDPLRLVKTGGGSVRVETGGDLTGGQYYADRGELTLKVGGNIGSGQNVNGNPLYTILALGDARARVQAQGQVDIHAVLNPHLVIQSSGRGTIFNLNASGPPSSNNPSWSLFSTYSEASGVDLQSLRGSVTLHNQTEATVLASAYGTPLNLRANSYTTELLSILPPSLSAVAFQGDILMNSGTPAAVLSPGARGDLTLLAAGSIRIQSTLVMSDRDPALIPSPATPGVKPTQFPISTVSAAERELVHATRPVHLGDPKPARVYAVAGNIEGEFDKLTLDLSKSVRLQAGQDIQDVGVLAQHVNPKDLSRVVAGRDVTFTSGNDRTSNAKIWIGGLGLLEVSAGRNIDLGTSAGIVSRGDLDNAQLPNGGVDIHLAAGIGAGIDYGGAVDRLIAELEAAGGSPNDIVLWQARWLVGNDSLSGSEALAAVKAVKGLDEGTQQTMVRELVYTALLVTGRDSNKKDSPYAANFERGYATLELVFPGIRDKNPDGSFRNYQGEINLFASRIKTERGGNIEFMVPGGGLIVGLANTPEVLVNTGNDVLGMVTVADGNIRGFARDNILVNQSRILTVGGGNVLLWSSEGDIDAGKGKKTATAVPPPIVKVDAQGNVTQELQGAASGSGIGALSSGRVAAGDIDLIAPRGTVNAGDAGIRAGNLNIAAQVVLGADNISVAGTSTGTPVADATAVTATTSGATSTGDDVSKTTAALSQAMSEAAQASDKMTRVQRPTFISTEVIGHGE